MTLPTLPVPSTITKNASGLDMVTFGDGTSLPLQAVLAYLYGADGNAFAAGPHGGLQIEPVDSAVTTLQAAVSGSANGTQLNVAGYEAIEVEVAGAFTGGTFFFEGTIDNWVTTYPVGLRLRGTSSRMSSTTVTGNFVGEIGATQGFRVRAASISGGTPTVTAVASPTAYADAISVPSVQAGTPAAYRTALVAADVLAAPGTVTCTKQAGGAATAGTYNVKVVAGNTYGRTTATAGNATVTTETTNLTVRAAFAAVTGATFYDVYCSTDADPKWVGRITETQRASGILITAVGVTGAGGTAGAVDIQAPGTGLQAATTAAVNTAYVIPANPINCAGKQYADVDVICSRTGDAVAAALVLTPFFHNATYPTYSAGVPQTFSFGGVAATYQPMIQRYRIECRGNDALAILVQQIAGTGMSVDLQYTLS